MDQHRQSRADRRRLHAEPGGEERRRSLPLNVTCLSQVVDGDLVVIVRDPIAADNCVAARDSILNHLREHREKLVRLDLSACTYIDTPGLSVLVEVKKFLVADGRALVLENPSRPVMRMLNITMLNRVFSVRYTNQDEHRIPSSYPRPKD